MKLPPALKIGAMAMYVYSPELDALLTRISKYGDEVKLGKRVGDFLLVPRALAPWGDSTIDTRSMGHKIAVNCILPPRNKEQEQVILESLALMYQDQDHIINASTGVGKTYMAINVMCQLKKTTLIIVPKEDLMDQWRDALIGNVEKGKKAFTDLKAHEVGIIQANKCHYEGKKVVLGMIHSLAKDKYGQEIKDYFGLVIWDEIHRVGAETFSETAGMFKAMHRLGLSATTNRADGKSFVFQAHIGTKLVQSSLAPMKPKVLMQKTRFRIPEWMKVYQMEPGKLMHVYKAMAKDPVRNAIIVDFLYAAFIKGRRSIAFSELKEAHLDYLYFTLAERGVPKDKMGYYVGGMSEKAREKTKHLMVIFATYGMTAEATDIPWLDTAVFCTPRANILQPIGRVLREWEDKKQPVVLDLVDDSPAILQGYASKRRTQYHTLGANIVNI